MLSDPKFVTRGDQPFAAINRRIRRENIPLEGPELIGEVAKWLAAKGAAPTGAPFFNYLEMDDDDLEMEVGFPTGAVLPGDGKVTTGVLPGGRYATLTLTGPYEQLFDANAALGEWLEQQDVSETDIGPGRYDAAHLEIYETDPKDEPNPAKWVTGVAFRVGN